jgi:lon-related putative ATP-dependent protease
MHEELKFTELKRFCDPAELNIKSTKDVKDFSNDSVIGQERVREVIEFGLCIKEKGFNIFASGVTGIGKTEFVKKIAEQIASREKVPPDLCYRYNFQEAKHPKILILPAGCGKIFRQEMEEFINCLLEDFPKVFNSKEYDEKKGQIVQRYQNKRDEIIKKVTMEAKKESFGVQTRNTGIYFIPEINGQIISEKEFDELSQEKKDNITKASLVMQNKALEVMRTLKDDEKNMAKEIDTLDYNIGFFEIGGHLNDLLDKYKQYPEVLTYLEDVRDDILDNIKDFLREDDDVDEQNRLLSVIKNKKNEENFYTRYKINLLVDNSELKYAPVITDFNPTYHNLMGEIEYENILGNLNTDFMKIKPGLFHKANGGYLILQATDIFRNNFSWDLIRRIIKSEKLTIEPLREINTSLAISSLKPEPLVANIKIIIVGNEIYYRALYHYDSDFAEMFRVFADFDYDTDFNEKSIRDIIKFVKNFVIERSSLDFDANAIAQLIEYSSRISGMQRKLSVKYSLISEILIEADTWAKLDSKKIITREYMKKAIEEHKKRLNTYEEKLTEMIDEKYIMIDTEGAVIGQINGLAVLDTGNYIFGKPTRITATTYIGKLGVTNIEKEADMSGNIHDKGIQVIIGYLGQIYAQDFPLSLSCKICFEQNYSGIDGDSASSTELYAVLSSLSDLPIRQDIAVTGSINQRGEIQVIGGITYKIEGFFDLCSRRGLTGKQGVIIPKNNVKDLVLNDEVIEAVKKNLFHIYPIEHVEEGIEILTGRKAGIKDDNNQYPEDSIHGLVLNKLRLFYEKSKGK